MKRFFKLLCIIIVTALPLSLFSQNAVIILDYMKVNPDHIQDYLEVEQEWKKIHEKRIEAGITTGWQLWQKMYATPEDPYQYITINWFKDFQKTFIETPKEVMDGVFTDEEFNALVDKTLESRIDVKREVSHQVMEADNSGGSNIIVLNHIKIMPGRENDYYAIEHELWKPYHEATIKAGYRTHWGIWNLWPYEEGQSSVIAVDGYKDPEQMATGEDLIEQVHPDLTWEEIDKKTGEVRIISSVEIWKLVDFVFADE